MSLVTELGTIMGIWAHPDDEIFSMAGIFTLASQAGQNTVCVTATRGEQGVQDESRWPRADLASIRTLEMEQASQILGIKYRHWLDYADGSCREVDIDEASNRLAEYINQYQPDTIFTFGVDGLTGHDDHKTMSIWTDRAIEIANSNAKVYHVVMTKEAYAELEQADRENNMFFNTDKPWVYSKADCSLLVELDDETLDKKMRALEAMPSQTVNLLGQHKESVRRSGRTESFILSEHTRRSE